MTIHDRKTGWLDGPMHAAFRELLLHAGCRYGLHCPAYCLMPDHAHFLWMGTKATSDQQVASAFFRRYWNQALERRGASLQKQPHDHVLNEHERNPQAFEDVCCYVLRNPETAGLTDDWRQWPFLGAVAAGFPDTDPRGKDWLGRFWKIYHAELRKHGGMES